MADKSIEKNKAERAMVRACCDVVQRKEGEINLRLEMPGVTREGLSINIDGDQLEIRGMRDLKPPKEGEYLLREIKDADFYQVYTIDETIDRNKIDASLKNGILSLTLGLKESEKPRKIQITAK